jgi:hypothetical protein
MVSFLEARLQQWLAPDFLYSLGFSSSTVKVSGKYLILPIVLPSQNSVACDEPVIEAM